MGAFANPLQLPSGLPIERVIRLVQAHGQHLQRTHEIEFSYHIHQGVTNLRCCENLPTLLSRTLTEAAITARPGSLVELAAHATRRGLEFEVVADCNSSNDLRASAFSRKSFQVNRGYQLSTYQARCPDGMLAWIVVQSQSPRIRR